MEVGTLRCEKDQKLRERGEMNSVGEKESKRGIKGEAKH
jgi:hypothetical protein